MTLTEFFHSIGAPTANAGATEAEISATEKRLAGQLPDAFRAWFREADGFEGEVLSRRALRLSLNFCFNTPMMAFLPPMTKFLMTSGLAPVSSQLKTRPEPGHRAPVANPRP
jgi:hypothetical protein